MIKVIFWTILIISTNGIPLNNEEAKETEVRTDENDLNLVVYIQSFKDMMLKYVKSQYNNLTINEMDAIKEVLEQFLHTFAKDLKEIIEGKYEVIELDEINDGIPDSTFDEVKNNIKKEVPNMNDYSASLIVYKLRKNLMITRRDIDEIVRDSQRATEENES